MALDQVEAARYADIVNVVNRSSKPVEFLYDGNVFLFKPNEKKPLPRFIAEHGINKLPITVDQFSTITLTSFLGIEGSEQYPTTPVDLAPADIAEDSKIDLPKELSVHGKKATMRTQELGKTRMDFSANNQE